MLAVGLDYMKHNGGGYSSHQEDNPHQFTHFSPGHSQSTQAHRKHCPWYPDSSESARPPPQLAKAATQESFHGKRSQEDAEEGEKLR